MKAGQITHSGTHSDDQLVSLCGGIEYVVREIEDTSCYVKHTAHWPPDPFYRQYQVPGRMDLIECIPSQL